MAAEPPDVIIHTTIPGGSHGDGGWMKPSAVVAISLGILAFFSSAVIQGEGNVGIAIVAGLLNPFFFVGVPLGVYWWRTAPQGGGHTGYKPSSSSRAGRLAQASRGIHGAAPAPSPVHWRLHLTWFAVVFLAMQLLAGAFLFLEEPKREGDLLPLAIAAYVVGVLSCAIIVVCWCGVIVKLISHGRVMLAAFFFFAAAVGCGLIAATSMRDGEKAAVCATLFAIDLLFVFLYGWGKAADLQTTRVMLVWTYCIAVAVSLCAMGAATLVAIPILQIH